VLSDGDILVAGTATTYVSGVATGSQFAAAEYTPAGTLDTSFGNGGTTLLNFVAGTLTNDVLHAIAVAPNGTIYLGGSSDAAGPGSGKLDFAVAALTPAGAPVSTFGTAGVSLVDISGGDDVINSLAVQKNGEIVAAGSSTVAGVTKVALDRLLANGKLDVHFGTRGAVTSSISGVYDSASSVVIQTNGEIVIGGLTASSALASDFLLQRYTAAGRLDRTFGGGAGGVGTVDTSFGQPAAVTQVVLQSNGEIVASGKTTASLASVTPDALDVAIARYSTRGVLDTAFNNTGKVIVDLSAGEVATPGAVANPDELQQTGASALGAQFDAFTASLQGVVTVSSGGEILDAGNSGANTVEAELVTAGVDLVARLLSTLPGSVLGGLKAAVTINITESGTQIASGTATITLQIADDAAGDGAVTVGKPTTERISLKQSQGRSYKLAFSYPASLPTGQYYLVVNVADGPTLSDLNTNNNTVASPGAVSIAPPFITLAGSGLTALGALTPGRVATFSLDITNTGNVLAHGRTTIDLYLSSDDLPADGTALAPTPLAISLPAGKAHAYRFGLKLPTTVAAGVFNLLAQLDPANSLATYDDTNVLVIDTGKVTVA
jgi:uncharacterized delta-60 repeat protein